MNSAATPPFRTVRVFISSTFRDMHAERDHLVRFVFPILREKLLSRRIHFVDVDLRWGVTGDQDVLTVCREVIDECRPRFVCLLGGRYGWVPAGKARSITADEVYYGVLHRDLKDRGFAFFYFRNRVATNSIPESFSGEYREPSGSRGEKALAELKSSIEGAGFKPFTYTAHWNDHAAHLTGLEAFGKRVFDDLWQSVTEEFGEGVPHGIDIFADEDAATEAFVDQALAHFVLGSREATEQLLLAYAKGSAGAYVCLIGEPGSGKSAVLAHVARQLSEDSALKVVSHFAGAGQNSANAELAFRRLCRKLGTIEDIDRSDLRKAFENSLKDASEKGRVVIVLDGINQIGKTDVFLGLSLLPSKLPPNCRIIISTTPGETLTALRGTLRHDELLLERLTQSDQSPIIAQFLHRFGKTMTAPQQSALLSKSDANLPLYLLAALEELRTLGAYGEINRRIQDLPATALALFEWIFKRLEGDQGFRNSSGTTIGPLLVKNVIAWIAASRLGLTESELRELLKVVLPKAVVACENFPGRAAKFLNEDDGSSVFLHYLEYFGSGETGLSGAIEDHAGEARRGVLELERIRDEKR